MGLTYEIINDNNLTQFYFNSVDANNQLLLPHWHNHLEIICLNQGTMTAYINDTSYELMTKDILIVNSKDIHYTNAHGICNYYLLQIPIIHLEKISSDWKLLHFNEYIPYSTENQKNKKLLILFEQLSDIHETKSDGYHLLMLMKLYELLYLLYTSNASILSIQNHRRNERDLKRIEQCMQYAKDNYKHPISLIDIANYINVTPEYFCRFFKKYTGQTYFTYIAHIRLLHFYQDLIQTQDSITYLLEKHGITNYKQFMRMFKESYGATPKQIRNKQL